MWTVLLALSCSSSPPAPKADAPVPPRPGTAAAVDTGTRDRDKGLFQPVPNAQLSDTQRDEIAALEAIGYVDGEVDAPTRSGVTVHDTDGTEPGLNLWTSGHAAEAYLMDAAGTVLHTWNKPWESLWTDTPTDGKLRGTKYWRRVHLYDNGDLLAIFEGQGLIKLDRDSNVLWKVRDRIHHDLQVLDDGRIVTLTRVGHVLPRIHPKAPILEDFVLVLDGDGRELRRVSLLDAVENSEYASWFREAGKTKGDLFHTNSIEVLDGAAAAQVPAMSAGRVLVSFRSFHTIGVVDLATGKMEWAARGPWKRQHDPAVLPSGSLMLFDNLGGGSDGVDASAVRELHPASLDAVWTYQGSESAPFYSRFCGAAQRLAGGNTLVSDSWVGRAFEVDPMGRIVWEFTNPHRAGEEGRYIAVLPEMLRVDAAVHGLWITPTDP